jgi:predicted lipoprotein with Yx(FWY)xxD motif
MRSSRIRAFGAAVALTLALAACGSTGKSATAVQSPGGTVGVTNNSSLGEILVDAHGRTLYLFQKDAGTTSMCTGQCATLWPPLVAADAPTAGSGANTALLGTTTRSDGTKQVTYNGHPVYLYSGDHGPGDATGEGLVAFGGSWFTLDASGNQVTSGAGSAGSTGSGRGYGY